MITDFRQDLTPEQKAEVALRLAALSPLETKELVKAIADTVDSATAYFIRNADKIWENRGLIAEGLKGIELLSKEDIDTKQKELDKQVVLLKMREAAIKAKEAMVAEVKVQVKLQELSDQKSLLEDYELLKEVLEETNTEVDKDA